ncbi:signal recognition particle receptor subunit [Moniliophthora roreri MCA 2997]|uniref:Signal recognition particle receptor subunit beta n=2 Tax=Moniliophthora roreri TaxID=221103 RepID=V2WDJ3_MONRO|nr:signal recognition particle receptor subunit [Moniliophthora roreri MCA 2997]KAI3616438.1 signal recognition particle receptor subunit [Moniliophthora roreri]
MSEPDAFNSTSQETFKLDTSFAQSPYFVPASLLAALIAIIAVVFLSKRSNSSRGNVLLLIGAPDSGKTALLTELVYGQTVPTHTSLQTNVSLLRIPGKKQPFKVIDIPGHPRIRDQFKEFLGDAKAVVFVVDANTVSRNGTLVAEHLHSIFKGLLSLPPSHKLPPVLILAHKTDLLKSSAITDTNSLAVDRVQKVLQRELEKRRVAQSGGMGVETMGSEDEKSEINGLECTSQGGIFQFESWEGGDVMFLGSSIRQLGLQAFQEWLERNM